MIQTTETTNNVIQFKKPYALRHRETGKIWRQAATRKEARLLKKAKNFVHEIVATANMKVVR